MSQTYRAWTGCKFGLCIPTMVERAMEIDAERGDTPWFNAIQKEMKNVYVAFSMQPSGSKPPPEYK